MRKITPENAIAFTKLCLVATFSWPPSVTATRWQIARFKILRFLSYVNMWILFVPLLLTFQDCSPEICIKTIPFVVGAIQVFLQMSLCYSQYNRLQILIGEMESHCKRALSYERNILQQYVDRCAIFYAGATTWYYVAAFAFICSAPFMSQPFPTQAKYPFEVEYQPLKTIIYIQQSYAGIQMASQLSINCLVALLLWFAAARFDILMIELRNISNLRELVQCIKKHQEILRYANEVAHAVRFLILGTVGCSTITLLFCGLTFIGRQPLIIKMQFLVLSFTDFSEVFMCCWPANNLLVVSEDVGQAAYESLWYSRSVYLQKNFIPILLRCQRPVTITIACVMPILSLKYFSSFISTAFSFFTALRVIIGDSDADKT